MGTKVVSVHWQVGEELIIGKALSSHKSASLMIP